MKKIFLLAALALTAASVSAQDIITKNNADEIKAKVVKVGADEIEYKDWDNLDGPVYTIPTRDVFTIKYANGKRDVVSQMTAQHSARNNKISTAGYPKYQGEVAVAYAVGFNSFDRVIFETVHGVRVSPYFFAGLGVACNYFYDFDSALILPVFANLKAYYPFNKDISVYLSFDAGAGIGIADLGGAAFYTALGPGVNIKNFDIGIRWQHIGTGTGAMQFRIGYKF